MPHAVLADFFAVAPVAVHDCKEGAVGPPPKRPLHAASVLVDFPLDFETRPSELRLDAMARKKTAILSPKGQFQVQS